MARPKLPKQDKGLSKSICLKPAEWKALKRIGKKSFAAVIRKLIEVTDNAR